MFILISHWVVVVTVAVCGCFLCVTQEKKVEREREAQTNEPEATEQSPIEPKGSPSFLLEEVYLIYTQIESIK